ncbi:putative F-box protein At1g44080 isoform X2 [Tasmannia lanceolata]|uniref:putative F-box protein At1g44080 isoform X2 n=1 Tax=Tasmannia lanceolata TaxID=3420 RepID=UPI004062E0C4
MHKDGDFQIFPMFRLDATPKIMLKIWKCKCRKSMDRLENTWGELPKEIIELILNHLILADYIRFGAVCVSWRLAVAEKRYPPAPQLSWIMISEDLNRQKWSFYSPSEVRVYRLNLSLDRGEKCVGSYDYWMVMSNDNGRNYLLSLFSRAEIQLPPSPYNLPDQWAYPRHHIEKAILSSAPTSADCVFVAMTITGALLFCRLGDEKWSEFEDIYPNDFAFYKGMFYATCVGGDLVVCSVGPPPKTDYIIFPFEEDFDQPTYLVESCGELLIVVGYWEVCSTEAHYKVFKLDSSVPHWVEVKSFGDHALFLNSFCCYSLPATGFPGFKKNCIYSIAERILKIRPISGCFV